MIPPFWIQLDYGELISDCVRTCLEISTILTGKTSQKLQQNNSSGDQQSSLDLLTHQEFLSRLHDHPMLSGMISEESAEYIQCTGEGYILAFDPLDGSSVAGTGRNVGTIIGIYKTTQEENCSGKTLVASLYALYGQETWVTVVAEGEIETMHGNSMSDFTDGSIPKLSNGTIASLGAFFAYKNQYAKILEEEACQHLSFRYSGSMVNDIHFLLQKKGGVFSYPGKKLRLLYEILPMAQIIHAAGGKAVNLKGENVLNIPVTSLHASSDIVLGSPELVDIFVTNFA